MHQRRLLDAYPARKLDNLKSRGPFLIDPFIYRFIANNDLNGVTQVAPSKFKGIAFKGYEVLHKGGFNENFPRPVLVISVAGQKKCGETN